MGENTKNKQVMHITSLTLGAISILTSWFWYITIPTGILAIVFGAKSVKKTGSKIGKAGLITGIIGLALFAFAYTSMIIILLIQRAGY